MADEPETMAEVRARANSHDGCPTDIFDRALAAHDARVRRDAQADALREAAGVIVWSAETLPDMTPHDAARGLVRRATDIEKED